MKNRWRKYAALALVCWILAGVFAVIPVRAEGAGENTDVTFDVKIVQTNDMHARIEDDGSSIGMDRLAGMIRDVRASVSAENGPDAALVLDAGDTFHGQSIATIVQGESVARLMKACGYDAMTPGNHDWSYGKDRLKELGNLAGTTMLAGNVKNADGSDFFENDDYIREVAKNGKTLKIGVFGVMDPQMSEKTTPSNVAGLTFTDAASYAKEKAKSLRNAGCNVVIALSHTLDPAGLAGQVDGVDLWLCGHEHTDIDTSVTTPNGGTAYVSESGYYLYEAGLIDLQYTIKADGTVEIGYAKQTIDYQAAQTYEKDTNVTSLIDTIKAENAEKLNQQVGTSPVDLDGKWEHLRIGQTNMGNVVTDAYLQMTGADIAFENAGGIRASVKAGPVTYSDVLGISPYGNYIVTKQLTGKQIKEMLETSIGIQLECIKANDSGVYEAWPDNSGSYLQIGGMTVEYDPEQPEGSRVLDVKVGDQKLDKNRSYIVAVNNYFASSSDYPQLAQAEEAGEFASSEEALITFFQQGEEKIAASASESRMNIKKKEAEAPENPGQKDPADDSETKKDKRDNDDTDPKPAAVNKAPEKAPKTADDSEMLWWILCLALSGGAGIAVCAGKKRISY